MRLSIVILDEEPGQDIGNQVARVLTPQPAYKVDVLKRTEELKQRPAERNIELLIPVLPYSVPAAKQLLSKLYPTQLASSILPVVHSHSLSGVLNGTSAEIDEFLVPPLVEAEVRIRVERLVARRRDGLSVSDTPQPLRFSTDDATASCTLMQIVGNSASMTELKRKLYRAARFEPGVLLTGETGTGKERCAHAMHYLSRRAGKPFVPVNCGAIPQDLFESEMYGHERGAFTGAHCSHSGLIAGAEGGTLFLDEIECLSLACQVKLLRFLQDQTYYPVGSSKSHKANVWVLAAANVDLPAVAKSGQFREDLYYRLGAVQLHLPPLRERKQDIPPLATHFLKLHGARHGTAERTFSPRALSALCAHAWPGNVRELENAVLNAIVFADGVQIEPEDLPVPQAAVAEGAALGSFQRSKAEAIERFERRYIAELLEMHGGNVTRAARAAEKERRAFGRLVKKYEIKSS